MIKIINSTTLTKREKEVMHGLLTGLSNKEIASRLGISVSTVKTFVEKIYLEFNIHSRAELILFAVKNGIIRIS